jgi:HPt (histidine-containing phosphotransfer) domain-containing protein
LQAWRENLHRLKGAAQSIGALALAQTAGLAEQAGIEDGLRDAWFKRLSYEFDRLDTLLQQ